jgi:integrase/recombinase XerD
LQAFHHDFKLELRVVLFMRRCHFCWSLSGLLLSLSILPGTGHLAYLADLGRSGVTRARKLASIREFFRYLYEHDFIPSSPAASVAIPKKERKQQTYLRPDEYARLLSAAGSNPRDFALLQVLLQTGIRVSELVSLTLTSVDMQARTILVAGKGNKERTIPLEKKGILALKNYLAVRPKNLDQHVFLNYNGAGISRRGAVLNDNSNG